MSKLLAFFLVPGVLLTAAAPAAAELTQKGNLFIRFDGGISPNALPRDSLAPIAVRIEGTIKAPARQDPPPLRRIKIEVHRGGRLNATGLPVCRRHQIDPASPSEALAACGPALVGGGGFTVRTAFADQARFVFPGEVLLFNSVLRGRPAILGHVYQSEPSPITGVIVFQVRRSAGTFGTVIIGDIPAALNRNGYLRSIFLQLQRRYTFRGRSRAYLSASCAAPSGFSSAIFPFARASMAFADGLTLGATLTRSCRVR